MNSEVNSETGREHMYKLDILHRSHAQFNRILERLFKL